jgi:hypothetical protein
MASPALSIDQAVQYAGRNARDRRHFRTVTEERRFTTPFGSPQAPLWEPAEGEWLRVLPVPPAGPRRQRRVVGEQPPLFGPDI